MDRLRVGHVRRKRVRRIVISAVVALVFLALAWSVSQLEPRAPSVDADLIYTDTVMRGEMVRQVSGIGTLVPETVVVIAASDPGRIERRFVQPGQPVNPSTVLLELSSPLVEQEYLDAEAQLKEVQADLANLIAQLEDERLNQESVIAEVEERYLQAKAQHEADLELAKSGLTDQITLVKSRVSMEQLEKRLQLEQARLDARKPSAEAQMAAQHARIEQMDVLVALRKEKVDRLVVKAGMDGVLQVMGVEVGQLVAPSDELARVSDPSHLKAALKIPETLVNEVAVGLKAEIDTRNGVVKGEVSRIDPAAIEGTVLVEVRLFGKMPRGARPDLSVDGTIELERLEDVLHVGRPIHANTESMIDLFKVEADQVHASRTQVQLGKVSVSTIEIRSGLNQGDVVVLSDMSAWDAFDKVRLE